MSLISAMGVRASQRYTGSSTTGVVRIPRPQLSGSLPSQQTRRRESWRRSSSTNSPRPTPNWPSGSWRGSCNQRMRPGLCSAQLSSGPVPTRTLRSHGRSRSLTQRCGMRPCWGFYPRLRSRPLRWLLPWPWRCHLEKTDRRLSLVLLKDGLTPMWKPPWLGRSPCQRTSEGRRCAGWPRPGLWPIPPALRQQLHGCPWTRVSVRWRLPRPTNGATKSRKLRRNGRRA